MNLFSKTHFCSSEFFGRFDEKIRSFYLKIAGNKNTFFCWKGKKIFFFFSFSIFLTAFFCHFWFDEIFGVFQKAFFRLFFGIFCTELRDHFFFRHFLRVFFPFVFCTELFFLLRFLRICVIRN